MNIIEINKRYSKLSDTNCCLSCGSAINYSKVKSGEVCVDLGSGRGNDAINLAGEVGSSGFVYGIDISDGMIEISNKNAEYQQLKNIKFIKSELEKINLPDNIADLVISNCTLNHVTNKQKVWNEIFRILKTNGRFVISDIYSLENVPEIYSNNPEAIAECWAGAVTKQNYILNIKNAGFKNFEIIEESKPYKKGEILVSSFTIKGRKSVCNCIK